MVKRLSQPSHRGGSAYIVVGIEPALCKALVEEWGCGALSVCIFWAKC